MSVRVLPDENAVARAAAATIRDAARAAVSERNRFRLALAGGNTPRLAYARLADERDVPWNGVEVFFGDERMVSPAHEASNFNMARAALLSRVTIPKSQVHPVNTELETDEAASAYEAVLGREPLDLVLLGMGVDGHTASLFPGGVSEGDPRLVAPAVGPPPHAARVTLTYAALAKARRCLFMVTGAAKASRLAEVFAEVRASRAELPAARVALRSQPEWLIDDAAAADLENGDDG
jgi:6-phosphogluconolactonase